MAFLPAQRSRLLCGPLNLSIYATQLAIESAQDMLDVTGFCDSSNADQGSKVFIPGQDSSTFSVSGNLDTDASSNGQSDVLTDWKGATSQPLTFAPSGLTALSECWLMSALQQSLKVDSTLTDAVKFAVETVNDGPADAGRVLENLTAVTADGNGTARDLTASSSNGGVAHIHVSAFSGFTSNVVTIEDSADGSTSWATILTFSTVTGVTSERVAITGTVRRYLRVVDNVTGTGSCTRSVAFARR